MLRAEPNGFMRPVTANQPMFQLASLGALTVAVMTGLDVEGFARPTHVHFPFTVPSWRYTRRTVSPSRRLLSVE